MLRPFFHIKSSGPSCEWDKAQATSQSRKKTPATQSSSTPLRCSLNVSYSHHTTQLQRLALIKNVVPGQRESLVSKVLAMHTSESKFNPKNPHKANKKYNAKCLEVQHQGGRDRWMAKQSNLISEFRPAARPQKPKRAKNKPNKTF